MTAQILQFKRKPETPKIAPSVIKTKVLNDELLNQLHSAKTDEEAKEILLLHFSQVCYYIFDLQNSQDPRPMLTGGINELFTRWCRERGSRNGK